MVDTCADLARGNSGGSRGANKGLEETVQLVTVGSDIKLFRSDENSTPMNGLYPTSGLKLLVGGANCIDIQAKALRKRPCTGQALARTQVSTGNGQHQLSCKLIPDGNATVTCEPKLHFSQELYKQLPACRNDASPSQIFD